MTTQFDVWICTYNSEKLSPTILPQINKVIPASAIHKKFIVDDFSSDRTKEIAQRLGWQVYPNKQKGFWNARNLAFSLVETEFCACFEHDILLAENWFPHIPELVESGRFDTAQGIRIRDVNGLKEADLYDYRHRFVSSEDNTFYKMKRQNGKYCIENSVCSRHLRGSLNKSLRHDYFIYYALNLATIKTLFSCLIKAPFLSLKIFKETKKPQVLLAYPLERLFIFFGGLKHK